MNLLVTDKPPAERRTFGVTVEVLRLFLPGEVSRVASGLLLLLVASAVALLQPWPLKLVLDCLLGTHELPAALPGLMQHLVGTTFLATHPKTAVLVMLCLGLLGIELLLGAFHVWSAYLLNSVALRLVFKLRCALFDHVQGLSLSFHDTSTVGDSLYRIAWDSYCVQSIFSEGLVPGLSAAATLIGIGVVMLTRDWRLTAATMGVAIPLILFVRRLEKPMTEQSTRVHEYEREVRTRVPETLVAIRAVPAH